MRVRKDWVTFMLVHVYDAALCSNTVNVALGLWLVDHPWPIAIQLLTNFTSGVHFSGMFSRESGLSIEKHIKMTSVSGYESGRSRS